MIDPASFWIESTDEPSFKPLDGDVAVDVAVLGAGITGVTAAHLLKEAGRTVALLESGRVLHGATGYTTAKVTSGHGLAYARLARSLGEETARAYAAANEWAKEWIASIIDERGIKCEFERRDNLVYTESASEVSQLEQEVQAMRRAGLEASLVRETSLPYPVAAAVSLSHQAQFHPRRFLLPLVAGVPGDGSHVFEHTRALDVETGKTCTVKTERGLVSARHVLVATHLPVLDRGLFFAKAHPRRAYVVAFVIDPAQAPQGMFITASAPTRSIRTAHDGDRILLLVGGEGHKPGEASSEESYATLERFGRERFGVEDVAYRWSTHDFFTLDRVPYVGRLRRGSEQILMATGYGSWGMTNGTAAAHVLVDAVLGRENRWSELYNAQRLTVRASATSFVKENANVARHFVGDRLRKAPQEREESLAPREGRLLEVDGRRVAAYRDEAGTMHRLSPTCTHLGCTVAWNAAERTWDCPCHGSRFDGRGSVIEGPAVRSLRRLEP